VHRLLRLAVDILKGKPAVLRSPRWHAVEKQHLKDEPVCQWCGGVDRLQVHHITPFHLAKALELDPWNLITLCEDGGDSNCHLIHGHLGNWRNFNPSVRAQCTAHRAWRV